MNYLELTNDQKQDLVIMIEEEHGNDLERVDFENEMALLLEDVPGFETTSPDDPLVADLVEAMWQMYQTGVRHD